MTAAHPLSITAGWTDERVAELKRLWLEEGRSAAEVASALGGCSRSAVIGKVHRLGLQRAAATIRSTTAQISRVRAAPRIAAAPKPIIVPSVEAQRSSSGAEKLPACLPEPTANDVARIPEPQRGLCRWPVGDPGSVGFGYCGLEAGGRYCVGHAETSRGQTPARTSRWPHELPAAQRRFSASATVMDRRWS